MDNGNILSHNDLDGTMRIYDKATGAQLNSVKVGGSGDVGAIVWDSINHWALLAGGDGSNGEVGVVDPTVTTGNPFSKGAAIIGTTISGATAINGMAIVAEPDMNQVECFTIADVLTRNPVRVALPAGFGTWAVDSAHVGSNDVVVAYAARSQELIAISVVPGCGMTTIGSAVLSNFTSSDNVPTKAQSWHVRLNSNGNTFVLSLPDRLLDSVSTTMSGPKPVGLIKAVDLSSYTPMGGSPVPGNPTRIALNKVAGGVEVQHSFPTGDSYEFFSPSGVPTPMAATSSKFSPGPVISSDGSIIFFCGMDTCPPGSNK
jgi:hypothetical protein